MEDKDDEMAEIELEREELRRRIQEKERLMDLINSRHIRGGLNEVKEFQERMEQQRMEENKKLRMQLRQEHDQKFNKDNNLSLEDQYLRQSQENQQIQQLKQNLINSQEIQEKAENDENQKDLNKVKFNSFIQGISMINMVVRIQRKWRSHLLQKNKDKIRGHYLNKLIKEFYSPISFDRVTELRKEIVQKLKSIKEIDPNDYQITTDTYLNNYKLFNEEFPIKEYLRENNFLNYYQGLELLKHLESMKNQNSLDEGKIFDLFMLDKNKEFTTKLRINEMEKAYRYKNDYYQYDTIDDFEESAILDEIDMRYNFESRENILNKKP